MTQKAIHAARNLVNAKSFGILSTISLKFEGFPFGSVVPYCLDGEGMPIVLISTIAQHTKNLQQNSKCSLTIVVGEEDVQATGRICILGNMTPIEEAEDEIKKRYYRHFPKSKGYDEMHDFSFYRLKPVSYRYIGGFGAIHWFQPEEILLPNPFHGKGEDRIVEHMNEDHLHNLIHYCEQYKGMQIAEDDQVNMVGIDALGFDLFVNDTKVRFEFEAAIQTAAEARKALVKMATHRNS